MRSGRRVFFDTNLLLDVIENRAGLVEASQDVLDRCDELQAETYIAWHTLATAYYLLKRGRAPSSPIPKLFHPRFHLPQQSFRLGLGQVGEAEDFFPRPQD